MGFSIASYSFYWDKYLYMYIYILDEYNSITLPLDCFRVYYQTTKYIYGMVIGGGLLSSIVLVVLQELYSRSFTDWMGVLQNWALSKFFVA